METGNKYLTHAQNWNNKFNCRYFLDIRPESSYYVIGEIYNHSIEGKFIKCGKLVDFTPRYIDCLFNKETYLAFGMDRENCEKWLRERFVKTSTCQKIDFTKQRVLILTFEEFYYNSSTSKQLTL